MPYGIQRDVFQIIRKGFILKVGDSILNWIVLVEIGKEPITSGATSELVDRLVIEDGCRVPLGLQKDLLIEAFVIVFATRRTTEIADQLNTSVSTVQKDWRTARTWLRHRLAEGQHGD